MICQFVAISIKIGEWEVVGVGRPSVLTPGAGRLPPAGSHGGLLAFAAPPWRPVPEQLGDSASTLLSPDSSVLSLGTSVTADSDASEGPRPRGLRRYVTARLPEEQLVAQVQPAAALAGTAISHRVPSSRS